MSFIPPAGGSPPYHRVGGEHNGKNRRGSHFCGPERWGIQKRKKMTGCIRGKTQSQVDPGKVMQKTKQGKKKTNKQKNWKVIRI